MVGKSSPHRRAKIIDMYVCKLRSVVLTRLFVPDSYGDMRITMNTLMIAKWKMLSHVHSQFVPDIVGPFLKVSLISEPGEFVVAILEWFVLYTSLYVLHTHACTQTQNTHAHTQTQTPVITYAKNDYL